MILSNNCCLPDTWWASSYATPLWEGPPQALWAKTDHVCSASVRQCSWIKKLDCETWSQQSGVRLCFRLEFAKQMLYKRIRNIAVCIQEMTKTFRLYIAWLASVTCSAPSRGLFQAACATPGIVDLSQVTWFTAMMRLNLHSNSKSGRWGCNRQWWGGGWSCNGQWQVICAKPNVQWDEGFDVLNIHVWLRTLPICLLNASCY